MTTEKEDPKHALLTWLRREFHEGLVSMGEFRSRVWVTYECNGNMESALEAALTVVFPGPGRMGLSNDRQRIAGDDAGSVVVALDKIVNGASRS